MAVLKLDFFGDTLELEGIRLTENEFRTTNWIIKLYEKDGKQFCRFTEPIQLETINNLEYLYSDSEIAFVDSITQLLAIDDDEAEELEQEFLYEYWSKHDDLRCKYTFDEFLEAYMTDELEHDLSDYVEDMLEAHWLNEVKEFFENIHNQEFECWIEEDGE
jgi:hypothetical protein